MRTAAIVLILILIFTFGLDIASYYYLKDTAASLSNGIRSLPQKIDEEDWASAYKDLTVTSKQWSSVKGVWAVLINHEEIDNIDMSLTRLKSFVKYNDTEEAMAEYNTFKMLVDHIPENQRFSLVNIF